MKNALVLMIALVSVVILSGCSQAPKQAEQAAMTPEAIAAGCSSQQEYEELSPGGKIFSGTHSLRKMFSHQENNFEASGSFFLCFGGLNAQSTDSVSVKFSWRMNDGVWAISSLPLEKFRIKFDNNAVEPTIKFRWRGNYFSNPDLQWKINESIVYVLLTVREEDWRPNVNLPLNKTE